MKLTSKAQEALDRILKSFEEGTVPEAIAKVLLPRFDIPSNAWSLNNRLLTCLQQAGVPERDRGRQGHPAVA